MCLNPTINFNMLDDLTEDCPNLFMWRGELSVLRKCVLSNMTLVFTFECIQVG